VKVNELILLLDEYCKGDEEVVIDNPSCSCCYDLASTKAYGIRFVYQKRDEDEPDYTRDWYPAANATQTVMIANNNDTDWRHTIAGPSERSHEELEDERARCAAEAVEEARLANEARLKDAFERKGYDYEEYKKMFP
jgi:hypothetical protein